jgi:hypothetical protein
MGLGVDFDALYIVKQDMQSMFVPSVDQIVEYENMIEVLTQEVPPKGPSPSISYRHQSTLKKGQEDLAHLGNEKREVEEEKEK